MPFWHLNWVIQTHLHAKGFVVPKGGTIVYRTFSIYNELCTKYHLLSIFSIKVIVIQEKVTCFQIVSIMYWQYLLISRTMRRLHFSLSYVGQFCIKKKTEFLIIFIPMMSDCFIKNDCQASTLILISLWCSLKICKIHLHKYFRWFSCQTGSTVTYHVSVICIIM